MDRGDDCSPVEAVWVFRFTRAPFKAVYGRLPGTTYSKDFLQASGECSSALDAIFSRSAGEQVPLEFKWPGGNREGLLFEAADYAENQRLEVRWETNNAPAPWKLFPDSSTDPLRTFPGDPTLTTEGEADAELERFESRAIDPWLVLVKLRDEVGVLHVRAYSGNPPEGLEHTSTTQLPSQVRSAMATVSSRGGCAVAVVSGSAYMQRAPKTIERILSALERSPNVLLVGPPGTGKTVALEDLRILFEAGGGEGLTFDPDRVHDAWSEGGDWPGPTGPVRTVVFHPSYSYEEFVIGLMPKPAEQGGVDVEARPGPLLSMAHWSKEPGNAALVIADEFNRGNAAAIFGDTLALLDRDKRAEPEAGIAGASIDRAYPNLAVTVAPELSTAGGGVDIPEVLQFSPRLWIVAAMNSSDRSVAPIDAALRRRFSIIRIEPDYELLASRFGIPFPLQSPADGDPSSMSVADVQALAVALLQGLNDRIDVVLGQDFLLGHSLVWDVFGDDPETATRALGFAFDEGIAPTLRMTFADQDEPLSAVFRGGDPPSFGGAGQDEAQIAFWKVPPAELDRVGLPRLHLRQVAGMEWQAAIKAIQQLI